jgi:hypothetical protein
VTLTVAAAAAWLLVSWALQSNPAEARRTESIKFPAPLPPPLVREPAQPLSSLDVPLSLRMQAVFTEPGDVAESGSDRP